MENNLGIHYDLQDKYFKEVAPILGALYEKCQELNMPMLVSIQVHAQENMNKFINFHVFNVGGHSVAQSLLICDGIMNDRFYPQAIQALIVTQANIVHDVTIEQGPGEN